MLGHLYSGGKREGDFKLRRNHWVSIVSSTLSKSDDTFSTLQVMVSCGTKLELIIDVGDAMLLVINNLIENLDGANSE